MEKVITIPTFDGASTEYPDVPLDPNLLRILSVLNEDHSEADMLSFLLASAEFAVKVQALAYEQFLQSMKGFTDNGGDPALLHSLFKRFSHYGEARMLSTVIATAMSNRMTSSPIEGRA